MLVHIFSFCSFSQNFFFYNIAIVLVPISLAGAQHFSLSCIFLVSSQRVRSRFINSLLNSLNSFSYSRFPCFLLQIKNIVLGIGNTVTMDCYVASKPRRLDGATSTSE